MGENHMLSNTFSDFQKHLDYDQDIRERIRAICKETDQLSREITTVLQIIHNAEEEIRPAYQKAKDMIVRARKGYQELMKAVPPSNYYKFYEHWRNMTQRYCFLIALMTWLETGAMVSHQTCAETLGINPKETDGFHLDIEDYLLGILQLCSELVRLAVNSVTRREFKRPMQVSKFIMEVNAGFRLLIIRNDYLRKRYEALKYDVKKIEEVVYDLSLRGLLPKQDEPQAAGAVNKNAESQKPKPVA